MKPNTTPEFKCRPHYAKLLAWSRNAPAYFRPSTDPSPRLPWCAVVASNPYAIMKPATTPDQRIEQLEAAVLLLARCMPSADQMRAAGMTKLQIAEARAAVRAAHRLFHW